VANEGEAWRLRRDVSRSIVGPICQDLVPPGVVLRISDLPGLEAGSECPGAKHPGTYSPGATPGARR